MLTSVKIQNFKCFDELILPLAPLTLLTGFNAAGKSTALQPILLISQLLRSGRLAKTLPLNGDLVELGTPGEILNEHSGGHSRNLTISISLSDLTLKWFLSADDRSTSSFLNIDNAVAHNRINVAADYNSSIIQIPLDQCAGALDEIRDIVFISAVRLSSTEVFPSPKRADPVFADVGIHGEYAPWWFEQNMDSEIDARRKNPNEIASTLRRQLNAWAGEIFPGADFNALRVPNTSLVRLELRTRQTETYRRPANIGYGLSYVFPILVTLLLAKPGQTVFIDSPEAHLHPRGQSAMGRLLALFASAGVQLVVETHSDHVLNGVRLAAKDRIIAVNDLAIHFFRPQPDPARRGSQVISIAADSDGNLSEWPSGFFDQSENDLAFLAGWS